MLNFVIDGCALYLTATDLHLRLVRNSWHGGEGEGGGHR